MRDTGWRPWHSGSVTEGYFDQDVAESYDIMEADMFEPAVVDSAVS